MRPQSTMKWFLRHFSRRMLGTLPTPSLLGGGSPGAFAHSGRQLPSLQNTQLLQASSGTSHGNLVPPHAGQGRTPGFKRSLRGTPRDPLLHCFLRGNSKEQQVCCGPLQGSLTSLLLQSLRKDGKAAMLPLISCGPQLPLPLGVCLRSHFVL